MNSARIGAAFLGPVAATTLLARGTPALVYLALGATGLVLLPLLWKRGRP